METDSQSESFNNGKLCEASEDDDDEDFELLWRKYFRDLGFVLEDDDHDVVLWLSVLGLVFWYSFFSPRSSFQRLEHLGAFGENRYGSVPEISVLRRDLADSGDLISDEVVGSFREGLTDESSSGISFPSKKSSSAGSIATGSSSLNSKSPAGASGSGFSDEYSATGESCLGPASLDGSSSRLKETRGLSQP
jgi:hypothetical protein